MGTYTSDDITVHFNGRRCIHARRCVLGLPAVFVPNGGKDWIKPAQADAEELARIIDTCPSGALSYTRNDGGRDEPQPKINSARLWENGPVEYRGDLRIPGQEPQKRALMCRCGQSKNKPYCDNSHIAAGFTATGDVPTTDNAETLPERDGPLNMTPLPNAPLKVEGNLEIIAASGRRIATGDKQFLCRCGHSQNKPFCDGSHAKAGWTSDED